jgi:hypothetical protein
MQRRCSTVRARAAMTRVHREAGKVVARQSSARATSSVPQIPLCRPYVVRSIGAIPTAVVASRHMSLNQKLLEKACRKLSPPPVQCTLPQASRRRRSESRTFSFCLLPSPQRCLLYVPLRSSVQMTGVMHSIRPSVSLPMAASLKPSSTSTLLKSPKCVISVSFSQLLSLSIAE